MQLWQCVPDVRFPQCSHTLLLTHLLWPLHWHAVRRQHTQSMNSLTRKQFQDIWTCFNLWLRWYICQKNSRLFTRTLDEGPVVAPVRGTQTLIQNHVADSWSNPGSRGLHRAPVGTFHANTFASVGGIAAPSTLGPLQTLRTRPQTWAVLSCGGIWEGWLLVCVSFAGSGFNSGLSINVWFPCSHWICVGVSSDRGCDRVLCDGMMTCPVCIADQQSLYLFFQVNRISSFYLPLCSWSTQTVCEAPVKRSQRPQTHLLLAEVERWFCSKCQPSEGESQ